MIHLRFSLALAALVLAGCAGRQWQVTAESEEMQPASQPTALAPASAPASSAHRPIDVRAGMGADFLQLPRRDDAVIARVGSEELHKSQAFEYMREAYPDRAAVAVSMLLTNRVIAVECAKHGIEVPLGEVVEWYGQHRAELEKRAQLEYGAGTSLAVYLDRTMGMTPTQYEIVACDRERTNRMMQRLVRYQQVIEERVELRIISVADQKVADDIMRQLAQGADFGALAKQQSRHASADKGGLMAPLWRGALNPALEGPAFALEEGKIAPIIRAQDDQGRDRYQILKLVKRHLPRAVRYAAVEDEIKKGLQARPFTQDEYFMWQLRVNRVIALDLDRPRR
jgi:hypothetical protein